MKQKVSVVIPCYKSSVYLENTVTQIVQAFAENDQYSYQLILIDDGSNDDTYEVIKSLAENNSAILGISLSTNCGQAQARLAALEYVSGETIVFMDDDGQHSPRAIFTLVEEINRGNDLVYAEFPQLKESFLRRTSSRVADWFMSRFTNKPKGIRITSFFAISSFALSSLLDYHSPQVFLGGYLFEVTKRISSVEVVHLERREGHSNYSFAKRYSLFFNNVLAFPGVLGKLTRTCGFLVILISILMMIYSLFHFNQLLVLLAFNFFSLGVIIGLFGIFGEILIRIYNSNQGVKPFKIRETTKCEDDETSRIRH